MYRKVRFSVNSLNDKHTLVNSLRAHDCIIMQTDNDHIIEARGALNETVIREIILFTGEHQGIAWSEEEPE